MKCNRIILTIVLFTAMFCFGGCGAKSDGKIREEIKEKFEERYSNILFSDINVDINKRQTNQEDKTDYITLLIMAENEDIELSCVCEAEYIKYNELPDKSGDL